MLDNAADRAEILKRLSPPSRRGRRADLTDGTLPSEIGAAGEVAHLLHEWFDLPGRADF